MSLLRPIVRLATDRVQKTHTPHLQTKEPWFHLYRSYRSDGYCGVGRASDHAAHKPIS